MITNSRHLDLNQAPQGAVNDIDSLGFRELAWNVFRQTFLDLGVQLEQQGGPVRLKPDPLAARSAHRFLFDPLCRQDRQLWLAWLGMDELELWELLRRMPGGLPNRVGVALVKLAKAGLQ